MKQGIRKIISIYNFLNVDIRNPNTVNAAVDEENISKESISKIGTVYSDENNYFNSFSAYKLFRTFTIVFNFNWAFTTWNLYLDT